MKRDGLMQTGGATIMKPGTCDADTGQGTDQKHGGSKAQRIIRIRQRITYVMALEIRVPAGKGLPIRPDLKGAQMMNISAIGFDPVIGLVRGQIKVIAST